MSRFIVTDQIAVARFAELLESYVPRFSIPLFELSEIPDERLGGDAFSQAALLLLKYVRRLEQLAGILESKFPNQGQALMTTLAEQWMNHGREEGLEKGLKQGLEQGRLIGSIQTCKKILGEPLDEAALRHMSLQELQRLAAELQRQVRRTPGDP